MAVQFDPIAKDESLNTTEQAQRNIADVLAQELSGIATAISGGGGGSGGHTIKNSSGTALPQRTNLQFGSGLGVTDDAVNDATVVELTGDSVHANMFVKLWENPNPASAFAAQAITLSSDDYDFLMLEYRYSIGTDGRKSVIASKEAPIIWIDITNNTYNGAIGITRMVTKSSDTSYSIGDGHIATGGSGQSTDNTIAIPTAIYGFKKSLDITAIVSNVSTDATRCIMSDGVTNVEDAVEEKAKKTDIATVESGSTASRAYSVGELVYVNGNLYKVITAISSGATFTVNTNIKTTNVSEGLRGGLIKSASFSTTTDGYGLTAIASLPRIVVAVKTDQSAVCTVFYTANGYAYVRVTSQSGATYANNPISGTYYYFEE